MFISCSGGNDVKARLGLTLLLWFWVGSGRCLVHVTGMFAGMGLCIVVVVVVVVVLCCEGGEPDSTHMVGLIGLVCF